MSGSRATSGSGLSPCVRGNLFGAIPIAPSMGSIPVRTGEPCLPSGRLRSCMVYPRAYGGTIPRGYDSGPVVGLSPCVRGNRHDIYLHRAEFGSIPVRTGEPLVGRIRSPSCEVYPRAYGGTIFTIGMTISLIGLSPCVRGNLPIVKIIVTLIRSIPVRTGEPGINTSLKVIIKVYPRAYGGTVQPSLKNLGEMGLSPCVRGNPPR